MQLQQFLVEAVNAVVAAIHHDLIRMDIQIPETDDSEATLPLSGAGYTDVVIGGLPASAMKQNYQARV